MSQEDNCQTGRSKRKSSKTTTAKKVFNWFPSHLKSFIVQIEIPEPKPQRGRRPNRARASTDRLKSKNTSKSRTKKRKLSKSGPRSKSIANKPKRTKTCQGAQKGPKIQIQLRNREVSQKNEYLSIELCFRKWFRSLSLLDEKWK